MVICFVVQLTLIAGAIYFGYKIGYGDIKQHIWLVNVSKNLLKRQNIVYFFTY
ncbi:hypothetical protein D3C87_952290 [compost metagenome]